MVATINTYVSYGGTDEYPSGSVLLSNSKLRFKPSDSVSVDSGNPIKVPISGSKYSYWKNVFLKMDDAGPEVTTVNNIKFYSDGNLFPEGAIVRVKTSPIYIVATGVEGISGNELLDSVNLNNYTVNSPLDVSGTLDSVDKISDYVILQLEVPAGTSSGTLIKHNLTWNYDET